jgi:hypothetical protein
VMFFVVLEMELGPGVVGAKRVEELPRKMSAVCINTCIYVYVENTCA